MMQARIPPLETNDGRFEFRGGPRSPDRRSGREPERQASGTLAALFLTLAVAAFLAGCDNRPARPPGGKAKKITVAATPWPASASLYIARDKGYFREEGLDAAFDSYPSGHLGLRAVLSGKADFATASETPIARAALDGNSFSIVATVSNIDRAILIVARKDKGISTARDLAGKRIGRVADTAADYFLHFYLTTSYIDPRRVRFVDLETDRVVPALLDGEVDAVSTWAPHTTVLRERLGENAVILHDPGFYAMTWNIVAARDVVQRDPDVIARFLRAVVRANRLLAERPGEARSITAGIVGIDVAASEKEWTDFHLTVELQQSLILALEDQARWMIARRAEGPPRFPNFLDFIYTNGLNAVEPRAVRIVGR